MRIIVVKARTLIYSFAVLVLAVLVLAVSLSNTEIAAVFDAKKDLPIYSVDRPEKNVAITFDCAWGADDIPEILSVLEKENVQATFFIVGQWAEKFPQEVKMIAAKGHDVANHSYSHLRFGALDAKRISYEISRCGEVLNQLTGKKVELVRPPYGDYNNTAVAAARQLGYYTIQWDVDSLDWKPEISRQEIMRRVTSKVRPGSIILFHNDTTHTAKVLPSVIASLKQQGYGFQPVSKLILRENFFIDFDGRQKVKEN